jgi:hypothetical protein
MILTEGNSSINPAKGILAGSNMTKKVRETIQEASH